MKDSVRALSRFRKGIAAASVPLGSIGTSSALVMPRWVISGPSSGGSGVVVGAGVSERVIVVLEGRAAGEALGRKGSPVDAAIVGIVDEVDESDRQP